MKMAKTKAVTFAAALAFAVTGCTVAPFDGEVISNSPTTIVPNVGGFAVAEGQQVIVWAKNASGGFEPVATTTSTSNKFTWNNASWWTWQASNVEVPNRFWVDKNGGACGRKATLKVTIENYDAYSIDQPYLDCFDGSMSTQEFLDACGSDNSPEFTVETCGAVCC